MSLLTEVAVISISLTVTLPTEGVNKPFKSCKIVDFPLPV